jgi:hypothetical protein
MKALLYAAVFSAACWSLVVVAAVGILHGQEPRLDTNNTASVKK